MGVKINEHYKPLSYFIRKDRSMDYYQTGERVEVPANEIIHVYKKMFPDQIRGYTPLAPVLLNLNSIEQYKKAEIHAALINSAFMGVWTKTGAAGDAYADYSEDEIDEKGDVAV